MQQAPVPAAAPTPDAVPAIAEEPAEEPADGDAGDESGIAQKDIDLVMQQAGVTRAKAVQALMDLTM